MMLNVNADFLIYSAFHLCAAASKSVLADVGGASAFNPKRSAALLHEDLRVGRFGLH